MANVNLALHQGKFQAKIKKSVEPVHWMNLLTMVFVKIALILGIFLTKKQEQIAKPVKTTNILAMVIAMSVHLGKSLSPTKRVANPVRNMKLLWMGTANIAPILVKFLTKKQEQIA